MSDRSFVRFGGLAAMLFGVTSWLAVGTYVVLGRGGQDEVGMEMFGLLVALAALWSLFAIVAVHWTFRVLGEAWSLFAMLTGLAAAFATMSAALFPIAFTRAVLARPLDPTRPSPVSVAATDPLEVMSLGVAGLYLLVLAILLWRGRLRRLAGLGFIASGSLLAGFFAELGAQASVVTLATFVGAAVAAPVFWIGMGVVLRRRA